MDNNLSIFGLGTNTSYQAGSGLRYTDNYWKSQQTQRDAGFVPNTGISSVVFNTVLSQTSIISYIFANVLSNSIIKSKVGNPLITKDIGVDTIDSETTADQISAGFSTFINRINDISGNGSTGTESVWRSRQIGYSDGSSSNQIWSCDSSGNFNASTTAQILKTENIQAKSSKINIMSETTFTDKTLHLSSVTINSDLIVNPPTSGTSKVSIKDNVTLEVNDNCTFVNPPSISIPPQPSDNGSSVPTTNWVHEATGTTNLMSSGMTLNYMGPIILTGGQTESTTVNIPSSGLYHIIVKTRDPQNYYATTMVMISRKSSISALGHYPQLSQSDYVESIQYTTSKTFKLYHIQEGCSIWYAKIANLPTQI